MYNLDVINVYNILKDMESILSKVLHNSCISHCHVLLDDGLGYWINPKNTTWFLTFYLKCMMMNSGLKIIKCQSPPFILSFVCLL